MNPVIRGIIIYFFIFLVFRIMGKRTLNETTTFDLVLLLIISEVTQQALVGNDFSLTTSALLICTLMGIDILLTLFRKWFPWFERVAESAPLILVDNGRPLKKRMQKTNVDEEDIMHAARQSCGLEKMEEIKYAVLEKDGSISIIPADPEKKG